MIEGMPVTDRLSFYYHSSCYVSVPNYTDQGGPSITARAETPPEGSMRDNGCPQT